MNRPSRRPNSLPSTPAVIARVVRGPQYVRTMVVSAEDSFDLNQRKLTWHWRVSERRSRENRDRAAERRRSSIVELRVAYHPRRPIVEGSSDGIQPRRYRRFCPQRQLLFAPGFVTFYTLDREDRTYNKEGRLVEIDYMAEFERDRFCGDYRLGRLPADHPGRGPVVGPPAC